MRAAWAQRTGLSCSPRLPTCSKGVKRRVTAASSPAASLAGELQADALHAGDHQELPILLLSQMFQWLSKPSTSRKGANTRLERLGPPRAQTPAAKGWGRERGPALKGGFTPCAQQAMGEHCSPGIPSLPPLPTQETCPKAEQYSLQLRQFTNQSGVGLSITPVNTVLHSNSSPPSCLLRAVTPKQPPEDWNF